VGEDRGLLFEPDNIDDLSDCMSKMWNSVEGCKQQGLKARSYVETEFNDKVFYEAIMSNYRSVLK